MTLVSNSEELRIALAAASPGDTIELAAGMYGNVVLEGYQFQDMVTIRSQDPQAPATFDTLFIKNSSGLTLDHIAVNQCLAEGEPDWSSAFRIDKSSNITVLNSEISGSADGIHTNDGQGVLILDSTNVHLEGNVFHDLKTGLSVGRSEYVDVKDNTFVDIRSDGVNLANVRHVVVDGNDFSNFHPAMELGDHPDMIQIWNDGSFGDMSDIVISHNTLIQGEGSNVQGIFIQGALDGPDGMSPTAIHDLHITGNVIDIGAAQGIWLSDVDQATISENSLTRAADSIVNPSIRTEQTSNVTIDHNTAPQIDDVGSNGLTYVENTITAAPASPSTIAGTSGADILEGGSLADIILGADGDDFAYGHEGNDRINGDEGNDRLFGDDGNDSLNGGAGNDELHGGNGNDGAFGGGGNDRLFGESGDDVLFGDGGNDMLNGGAGADQLHGGTGNDGFFGGGSDDHIFGDAGIDTIFGDGGNDVIDGGTGNDVLRGGLGADTFVFAIGCGSDDVLDFQCGSDKLDFSGLSTVTSMDDLTIVQLSATSVAVSYFDGVNTVELDLFATEPFVLDTGSFFF